tara:strand:- start:14732 stop:15718 length:987 start_codon:yes stop_codon:yes gene_type:complete
MEDKGTFVMSLDLELFWGVRDVTTFKRYGPNIANVHVLFPRMLDLFRRYGLSATFATVGFLFAKNKKELVFFSPTKKPNYNDKNLSPYEDGFVLVKEDLQNDLYHYGYKLIELLAKYPEHEIATHTYSHFYCQEPGQTIDDFRSDLHSAIKIATRRGITIKSIVFPRNQVKEDYLIVCSEFGISSYRGIENAWFHKVGHDESSTLKIRIIRTLDCYISLGGHSCFSLKEVGLSKPYNIPSSQFLRPYVNLGGTLVEKLKLRRIKKAMTYAAKNGLIYHLWWHPHNFGNNTDRNLASLKEIFEHYKKLNLKYDFKNKTMMEIADILDAK